MSYDPPLYDEVDIDLSEGSSYVSPDFDAADIDLADAAIPAQPVQPSGFNTFASGTPSLHKGILGIGFSSSAFGTPYLVFTQNISATGFSAVGFGTPTVYDPTLYINAQGTEFAAFGQAYVYNFNQQLSLDTLGNLADYGTPSIENKNRSVFQSSFETIEFGNTLVYNSDQYRYMQGFDSSEFGTAYIIGPRYLGVPGYAQTSFGTQEVSNYYRYITVNTSTSVSLGGILNVGFPVVQNEDRAVYPDALPPSGLVGAIVAMPPFDIIDVSFQSISDGAFGTPDVDITYPRQINLKGRGMYNMIVGTPRITPHMIYAGGLPPPVIQRPRVENFIRYVYQLGSSLDPARYGNTFVDLFIRHVYPTGINQSVVWSEFAPLNDDGTIPGVYGPATIISPDGFEAAGTTYDNCGYPRIPAIPRPSVQHG